MGGRHGVPHLRDGDRAARVRERPAQGQLRPTLADRPRTRRSLARPRGSAYATNTIEDEDEPAGIMLLRDLAGIFEARRADRLQSATLSSRCSIWRIAPGRSGSTVSR